MVARKKTSKPPAKRRTKKRGKGRPRKYESDAARKQVYEAIASGLTLTEACRSVGATYRAMLHEAERDPEFAAGIEQAKEDRVTRIKASIFRPFALDPAKLSPKEITAIAIHGVRVAERIPEMREEWAKRSDLHGPPPPPEPSHVTNNFTIVNIDQRREGLAAIAERLRLGSVVDAAPAEPAIVHPPATEPSTNGNGKHHGNGHAG